MKYNHEKYTIKKDGGKRMAKVLLLNGSRHQHGCTATALEDVKKDLEGLQTMRNLARNMSFMIKAFADAKGILLRGARQVFPGDEEALYPAVR